MSQLTGLVAALVMVMGQASVPLVQSVDVAVPMAPVTFTQGGRTQLVYELHITNFTQTDVTLAVVDIESGGQFLTQYSGEELKRRVTRPGFRNDHPTPDVIGPGMRAIVNIWLAVPPGPAFVQAVTHAIELDVMRPGGAVRTRVSGGAARVSTTPVVELAAPLRGGPWVAIYDPLLKGGHRTAIYTLDGRARIPGRYAIDFIRLPPFGALPQVRAADANGFGAEVLAVADGTITIAIDGMADATPPANPLEQGSGNHIALDLGGGRFAFYEHLQQGSVAVKPGQRVKTGEVIARLGSSGSTSIGPHLHFHVADASATLAAEGLPFVFRQFTDEGAFDSITALTSGEKWRPAGAVFGKQHERPDTVSVIRFP